MLIVSKESVCNEGDPISILGQEDPLQKEMETHASILAWEACAHRSQVDYSPWGCKSQK